MHSAEPEKKRKTASAEGGQVPAVHETAEKLKELEQIIGISFHNKELLRQALSHSSYANEHRAQDAQNNVGLSSWVTLSLNWSAPSSYILPTHSIRRGT